MASRRVFQARSRSCDLVILAEGDRVPADATIIAAHDVDGRVTADRRIAREEGLPTNHNPQAVQAATIYLTCIPVGSSADMAAPSCGNRWPHRNRKDRSAITRIETEPPRLQAETCRLVRRFAAVGLTPERTRPALWSFAWRLARRGAEWYRARHVDAAGRIPSSSQCSSPWVRGGFPAHAC